MRRKRSSRLIETPAIGMIGAGIIGAIRPKRHMRLWRFVPNACRDFFDALADRPRCELPPENPGRERARFH
jgi:hypothetical protein